MAAAGRQIMQLICKATAGAVAIRWHVAGGEARCADQWSDGTEAAERMLAEARQWSTRDSRLGDMLQVARDSAQPVLVADLEPEAVVHGSGQVAHAGWRSGFAIPLPTRWQRDRRLAVLQWGRAGRSAWPGPCLRFHRFAVRTVRPRQRTQRQVRESDVLARKLADVSADWYWEHDAESRVTFLSPSIRDAIGVDPQTVIGKSRQELRGTKPLNCTGSSTTPS